MKSFVDSSPHPALRATLSRWGGRLRRHHSTLRLQLQLRLLDNLLFGSGLILDQLFEFFHAGPLAEILQAEVDEEVLRGLIKNGATKHFFPPRRRNEFFIKEC